MTHLMVIGQAKYAFVLVRALIYICLDGFWNDLVEIFLYMGRYVAQKDQVYS